MLNGIINVMLFLHCHLSPFQHELALTPSNTATIGMDIRWFLV